MKKLKHKFVFFNGHGSDNAIYGHNDEVLVESEKNSSILKERIVYARSCHSAMLLGEKCMNNTKEGCFIGYNIPFKFYVDMRWISNPNKDKIAGLFLFPSNTIPSSLIKGNSAKESHERAKKQMLKNIKKALKTKTKESFLIAEALWNNYSGQKIIGNESAKL